MSTVVSEEEAVIAEKVLALKRHGLPDYLAEGWVKNYPNNPNPIAAASDLLHNLSLQEQKRVLRKWERAFFLGTACIYCAVLLAGIIFHSLQVGLYALGTIAVMVIGFFVFGRLNKGIQVRMADVAPEGVIGFYAALEEVFGTIGLTLTPKTYPEKEWFRSKGWDRLKVLAAHEMRSYEIDKESDEDLSENTRHYRQLFGTHFQNLKELDLIPHSAGYQPYFDAGRAMLKTIERMASYD